MDKLIGEIYLKNGVWSQDIELDMTDYKTHNRIHTLTANTKAELKILISKILY